VDSKRNNLPLRLRAAATESARRKRGHCSGCRAKSSIRFPGRVLTEALVACVEPATIPTVMTISSSDSFGLRRTRAWTEAR